MNKRTKTIKGYTIIEMIFYVALVVLLTISVVSSLVVMTRAFKETSIQGDFIESANIMERISRETRFSNSINAIGANDLKLNTKDDAGNAKTVRFVLSNSNIEFYENDVFTGNLNSPNIAVTALSFVQITTTQGKAVKISLTFKSNRDTTNRTKDFYDTIVLRGNYGN